MLTMDIPYHIEQIAIISRKIEQNAAQVAFDAACNLMCRFMQDALVQKAFPSKQTCAPLQQESKSNLYLSDPASCLSITFPISWLRGIFFYNRKVPASYFFKKKHQSINL
jgi:uncharacterized membrane protein AbrB (regulator of aidB expression)